MPGFNQGYVLLSGGHPKDITVFYKEEGCLIKMARKKAWVLLCAVLLLAQTAMPLMGSAGGVSDSVGISNMALGSLVTAIGVLGPTVTFKVDDVVYDVYTVPNGQIKYKDEHYYCDAALPAAAREDWPDGMVSFRGWYIKDINGALGSLFNADVLFNDDIVVHALFSDRYLVSFMDYDGNIVHTADLKPDEVIYPPPQEVLNEIIGPEGFRLEYWYLEGGDPDTRLDLGVAKPTVDLVLVPKFSNLYYVVFISEGDQLAEPVQAVVYGGTINKPTQVISRTGYHFLHWSEKEQGQPFDFGTPITKDTSLYAVWEGIPAYRLIAINYVSEDVKKGTVTPTKEDLAPAADDAIGSIAAAAAGYRFVNWTNEAGQVAGTDALFIPAKVNGLNVAATYTAHFAENDDTVYAVEHYLANVAGAGFALAATEYFTGTTGELAAYAPSAQYINAGYVFIDSLTAMNPADGTILGNGESVIRLYYSRESYTVTYHYLNNPVPAGASPLPVTGTYVFGQQVSLAPDATAAGFTFDGWQNAPIVTDGFFTMPAQNVHIFGSFNYNLYTVTVHYQYADGTTAFESVMQVMAFGTYYKIPSPSLAGYRRSPMLVDGVMPAQNLEFTVTYTPDGGSIILKNQDIPLAGIGSRNVGDCSE